MVSGMRGKMAARKRRRHAKMLDGVMGSFGAQRDK